MRSTKSLFSCSMRLLSFATALMLLAITSACNKNEVKSDPETESRLDGTWQYSLTDVEDGVTFTGTITETFDASNHKFDSEIRYYAGYPLDCHMATVSYSGTWKASKEMVEYHIDKKSVNFLFNNNFLNRREREEFRAEMLEELEELEDEGYVERVYLSEITDTYYVVEDNEETVAYRRVK